MENRIEVKKVPPLRGEDEHRVISVRTNSILLEKLEKIAMESNRSRNEVINMLLEAAVSIVKLTE